MSDTVLTPEQQDRLNALLAEKQGGSAPTVNAQEAPVDSQRLRMMAQGLLFGFADELEAIVTKGDMSYEDKLAQIREKISAYKKADPMAALGYEALGAAPTAFFGPLSAARGLGFATRAAGEGALAAAGAAEGDITDRLAAIPMGAVGGVAGGAVGSAIGSGIKAGASGVTEFARRKLGDKGASVVSREIQRLVMLTGRTEDEILRDIAEGRIMAENKTLQNVARAYFSSNTPAKPVIAEGFEKTLPSGQVIKETGMVRRPIDTRARAMETAQRGITPSIQGEDVIVQGENILETARKAAGAQYGPSKEQDVGDELRVLLADTLERIPSAAEDVKKALDLELKGADFYTVAQRDDGSSYIIFNREPTVEQAEKIRSTIADIKDKAFKEGSGTFGSGLDPVESSLRDVIDRVSPETADARLAYKIAKQNKDAFEKGLMAMSGDTFQTIDYIRKLTPEQRQAYKVGFMSYLRNKGTKGLGAAGIARDMANEEGAMQRILVELVPENQANAIVKQYQIAKQAQEASSYVLSGSGTEGTRVAKGGIGQGTGVVDATIRAAQGDMTGLLLQARKLVAENTSVPLTDKQMEEVAQYLVTTNPDYLATALKDDGMFAGLAKYIDKLGTMVARGGRVTGAQQVGGAAGTETGPLLIDVTKALGEQ